jgi:hypothetical protein
MYVVAIPSYQRAHLLVEKTLATLKRGHVSVKHIHIFVANEQEAKTYSEILPKGYKIIVGVKGINEQRKFISRHFPEGQHIVAIDDDIADVVHMDCSPVANLHEFFSNCFKTLKQHKLYIWGIYPVNNPFYMKGQKPVTTCLRFIIATMYGFVNRHSMITDSHIEEKEDVENSIRHYLEDGGVLRFNHIALKTKFKNTKGGLGGLDGRLRANKEAAEFLHAKYPDLTRIKVRKNGMHEIVLKPPKRC